MSAIDELDDVPETVSADEVKLARQVVGNFEGAIDLTEFTDEYQAELRRIIDAKVEGEETVEQAAEAPAKVVNLMDALRKSLDSVSASKKQSAKATKKKTARAVAPAKKRQRA